MGKVWMSSKRCQTDFDYIVMQLSLIISRRPRHNRVRRSIYVAEIYPIHERNKDRRHPQHGHEGRSEVLFMALDVSTFAYVPGPTQLWESQEHEYPNITLKSEVLLIAFDVSTYAYIPAPTQLQERPRQFICKYYVETDQNSNSFFSEAPVTTW